MLQKFDSRNENILVYVKDGLYPRNEARVSVFDSVVQGGDAVWEGLRVYNGSVFCLDKHLNRLYESAKACHFSDIPSESFIKNSIFQTLNANEMNHGVHIRLTLTRGEKITSGMDPRLNQSGSTLIVLAEWKPPVYDNTNGIKIISVSIQRNSPRHLDSKIHHNNLLNNILAKIQSNIAGADAALMLDASGFVSELNGTNIFMVKNEKIFTPHATACLPGITRGLIIEIAKENKLHIEEKDISLSELYNADEVFTTGTMGELTPVTEIDARIIENRSESNILKTLNQLFEDKIPLLSTPIPLVK